MPHQLNGDMKHCFCLIIRNNAKCCVCNYEIFDKNWDELGRQKAYAVAVLAEIFAGAQLPRQMIQQAEEIRAKMVAEGTWASA